MTRQTPAVEGGAEVRLGQRRELGLEGAGRTGEMKGEVDRARFGQWRAVDRAEHGRGNRVWSEIQKSERCAHRIGKHACRWRRRQLVCQEAVGAGVDLDALEHPIGTDAAASMEEGPMSPILRQPR